MQSVDLSLFAFFSYTSEASPQVVAYFTVAMATAHGKPRVFDEGEKKKKKKTGKKPSLTFRRAAPWMSVGGFSFAKCVLSSEGPLTQNKMDTAAWAPGQPRWATFIPLKASPQMG